jgi:membrane protein implicated in regulation of membrane protease activity
MRLWIKPRIAKKTHHPSPMSTDRMIGQQYNIVRLENKSYVFADGKYWPTDGAHQFDEGDIVIIQ